MTKKLLLIAFSILAVIGILFLIRTMQKEPVASGPSSTIYLQVNAPSMPTVAPTPEPVFTPTPTPDMFDSLAPTVRMPFEELVGDNGNYDMPAGYPAEDTYHIIVDLYHQVVLVYTKDSSGLYTVPVRYMLCSSGKRGKTPVGNFLLKCYRIRFGLFSNDGTYGQYWTLIDGRIYFHSILYSRRDASTYIASAYNNLGTAVSHGCIRLTVPDARFIFYNCAQGTSVEIREGSEDDLETQKIRDRLILPESPSEHLTLKPGEIPFNDNWKIEQVPNIVPYVQGSQQHQK